MVCFLVSVLARPFYRTRGSEVVVVLVATWNSAQVAGAFVTVGHYAAHTFYINLFSQRQQQQQQHKQPAAATAAATAATAEGARVQRRRLLVVRRRRLGVTSARLGQLQCVLSFFSMIDFHACLEPPPPAPLLLCFAVPFNEFAFNQSSAQSERHP